MNEPNKMPKPSAWDELFPNRWLKAGLMKGRDVTLTIKSVDLEKLPDDKGIEKTHGILTFEKTDKNLQVNKTNGLCLKAMFGSDLSKWPGKRVTFFPTTDKFGGETVAAIRIRGSPDIDAPITITLKFKKRKPRPWKLVKTDPKNPQVASAESAPDSDTPEPPPVDDDGPPPDVELPKLSDQPNYRK